MGPKKWALDQAHQLIEQMRWKDVDVYHLAYTIQDQAERALEASIDRAHSAYMKSTHKPIREALRDVLVAARGEE